MRCAQVAGESFLPAGFTLRFPRCAGCRYDKSHADVESFETMQRRHREGKAKIATSKRTAAEVANADPSNLDYGGQGGKRKHNKQGSAASARRKVGVMAHHQLNTSELQAVAVTSDALRGTTVAFYGGMGAPAGDPSSVPARAARAHDAHVPVRVPCAVHR